MLYIYYNYNTYNNFIYNLTIMITKILDMVFTYLYVIYENAIHRIYK